MLSLRAPDDFSIVPIFHKYLSTFTIKTADFDVHWTGNYLGFSISWACDNSRYRGQRHLLVENLLRISSVN